MLPILFASIVSIIGLQAHAQDNDLSLALDRQIRILSENQKASGAFFPTSCTGKNMKHICYEEKSAFVTSLILESFLETSGPKTDAMKVKALAYLEAQITPPTRGVKYFDRTATLAFTAPADVDDYAIFYGTLRKANIIPETEEAILTKIMKGALIETKIKEVNGSRSVKGKYLSTWINHSKPFFNDKDIVVNLNALFGLLSISSDTHLYSAELTEVCNTSNTILNWSLSQPGTSMNSVRHWYFLHPKNYSQWYPYQYEAFFSAVRAYLASGRPACLESSLSPAIFAAT